MYQDCVQKLQYTRWTRQRNDCRSPAGRKGHRITILIGHFDKKKPRCRRLFYVNCRPCSEGLKKAGFIQFILWDWPLRSAIAGSNSFYSQEVNFKTLTMHQTDNLYIFWINSFFNVASFGSDPINKFLSQYIHNTKIMCPHRDVIGGKKGPGLNPLLQRGPSLPR